MLDMATLEVPSPLFLFEVFAVEPNSEAAKQLEHVACIAPGSTLGKTSLGCGCKIPGPAVKSILYSTRLTSTISS